MNKNRFAMVASIFAAVVLFSGAYLLSANLGGGETKQVFNASKTGIIVPRVCDGWTDEPIKGATIVVPELKKEFITDETGKVSITAPIIKDSRFSGELEKDWGEITLLVYADKYLPYALFYAKVLPETQSRNINILMFKPESITSTNVISVVEGPKDDWVENIIKDFDPNQ